jgi:hypothetical protein
MLKFSLPDFSTKLQIHEVMNKVIFCLFILGSWHRTFQIIRCSLTLIRNEKEMKGTEEGKEREER